MRQHCMEQARSMSCAAEGRLDEEEHRNTLGGVGNEERIDEFDEFGGVVGEIGLGVANGSVAKRVEVDGAVVVLEGGRIER